MKTEKAILYSTGCPRCNVLKKKLADANIEYTEVNDVDEMLKIGLKEVPYLVIGENMYDFKGSVEYITNMKKENQNEEQ